VGLLVVHNQFFLRPECELAADTGAASAGPSASSSVSSPPGRAPAAPSPDDDSKKRREVPKAIQGALTEYHFEFYLANPDRYDALGGICSTDSENILLYFVLRLRFTRGDLRDEAVENQILRILTQEKCPRSRGEFEKHLPGP